MEVPSPYELDRAITKAADYIERSCSSEGKLLYQVEVIAGKGSSSYNVVRHAGTMYSLGLLQRSYPNPNTARTLASTASFLRHGYIGQGPQSGELAVWSSRLPNATKAELGATGLGLVALLEARRINPQSVPLEELQSRGRFLLFLQRDDGSFIEQYNSQTGPVQGFESSYYPGEAALGLIPLYELDHPPVWLAAASKALGYLARSRAGSLNVPRDHWALTPQLRFILTVLRVDVLYPKRN